MRHVRHILLLLALIVLTGVNAPAAMAQDATTQQQTTQTKRTSDADSKKNDKSVKNRTSASAAAKNAATAPSNDSLTNAVHRRVINSLEKDVNTTGLRVNRVTPDSSKQTVDVVLNDNFTYLPVTQKFIDNIRREVSRALPDPVAQYRININVGDRPLSYYLNKIDRAPANDRSEPFVVALNPDVHATKGMEGDIVALWHSHGRYYRGGSGWQWQRPFLYETAEDVFTMGFILPYVTPMIENAGGYVMLPRERDTSVHEVIVDNDTNDGGFLGSQPYYKEQNGEKKWREGKGEGFIYDLPDFRDTENPFEGGTYREVGTIKSGRESVAGWYADIPEDGEYAIYVSYKTLPNSTKDAHYTVNYSGGSKEFMVNQTMGGGTWIYLGTFPLEKGYSATEPVVTLTNVSKNGGETVVTADAIKIGGGMGNIARSASRRDVEANSSKNTSGMKTSVTIEENVDGDVDEQMTYTDDYPSKNSGFSNKFSTSGMPRFVEGARYWLHWAGFPESVYSPFHGNDDYKDDYTSRALWVNYLAGGSKVMPNRQGLNIPVDVSFALHTDAGKRSDDSTVGTLGIYFTGNGGKLADGTSRLNSRNLTDILMRQIVGDVRAELEPNWTRRSMWDKAYIEAKTPEVPAALIELLSHQNFGDMVYGLDPTFRFVVGRAIYKALGRFIAERKGRQFVAQPLPVHNFAIARKSKGVYVLTWAPTPDPVEQTAMPTKYIIYERSSANLGFRRVAETTKPEFELKVNDTDVHSFKIIAANDGGVSFPSEILALREAPGGKAPLLIINGFTRVSGPDQIRQGNTVGFKSEDDFGVPYIRDISFSGHQNNFQRSSADAAHNSQSNYVTKVIAGNTFDFVMEHGMSIAEAGFGFVSASAGAVEAGKVDLQKYRVIDYILGKQKGIEIGRGASGVKFRAFPPAMQNRLRNYVEKGGNLFVSGAYVSSDLYGKYSEEADRKFASEVLGLGENTATPRKHSGRISPKQGSAGYQYNNTLNDRIYVVEMPDALYSSKQNAQVLFEFSDSHEAAALTSKYGNGRVVVMSVPFETITGEEQRDRLMKDVLNRLN